MQKLLLTGLLIFIKPGTATQLGAGFIIAIFFFVLHIQTNGYIKDEEDTLQFCCMLCICLTLFSGLLLQALSPVP